jgi:hypothetical protein
MNENVPAPPPPMPDCYRCGRPAHEHNGWRCPGPAGSGASVPMLVVGAIIGIAGAMIWFTTRTKAALCGSALVTALNPGQCDAYTAVHDIAAVGFLLGVVLVVIAAVRR